MYKKLLAVAVLVPMLAMVSACSGAPAASNPSTGKTQSCGAFSVGVLDDASHRVGFWALDNGKIKSDKISEIKTSYLPIPTLISATGTDQYDAVETAVTSIAQLNNQGGDVHIVALGVAQTGHGERTYVSKGSPIKTPADLKGKSVTISSLGATNYYTLAYVYQQKYGLNASPKDGDVKWVQLDPATGLDAVKTGHVDAAVLSQFGAWQASQDSDLRAIDDPATEYKDLTGSWSVNSAFVVNGDQFKKNKSCIVEFQRMLLASTAYAKAHVDEIAQATATASKSPVAYAKYWWASGDFGFAGIDQTWVKGAQSVIDVSVKLGFIPKGIDIDSYMVR